MASLKREQIRHEHAKWSDSTFGCVGPIGPLKHLSKEALEAAAEPDDLSEWADTRASTLKAKLIHIFYISNLLLISNQCYVVISLMLWR
ncbi:dATP/dGTP pyrophosphohydrolase domain-containing protein [Escherichia coli]|uniref:dATP/dGTP pyrophosphohydrolase domain-containing protein n=1 Tax=Escherichia coli TaxID=562 RepID=UPI00208FC31A|nr:dATP/dGTP pyrophosphohydrolase domain-containing protein [Escherichia coli]